MQDTEIERLINNDYYIAVINGADCNNLKSTINVIARAFKFPDYYGENMDAFDECIHDQEGSKYFKIFLLEISQEWAGVTNYKFPVGHPLRRKADFKVLYR